MLRSLAGIAVFLMLALTMSACTSAQADTQTATVYRSPACGCCEKWVSHLEENGFKVKREDMNDRTPLMMRHGVPYNVSSCHTAVIGDYVVEGHVPADVIKRMLEEKPDIKGIGVPGMPIGSPGMEGPNPEPYDVIAFGEGGTSVYASR